VKSSVVHIRMPPDPVKSSAPVRLMCRSSDKACHIAMVVDWMDDAGQTHHWNSWDDALCGFYKARKLLPSTSRDIRISFETRPNKRTIRKVDRHKKCAWSKDGSNEVILLRSDGRMDDIDAAFEIRGGLLQGAHVWRAWNAANGGEPQGWEYWPNFDAEDEAPYPSTLAAADAAAPPLLPLTASSSQSSPLVQVERGMARLRASAAALCEVRQNTKQMLQAQEEQLLRQWYGVNSTRTVAAGMLLLLLWPQLPLPVWEQWL